MASCLPPDGHVMHRIEASWYVDPQKYLHKLLENTLVLLLVMPFSSVPADAVNAVVGTVGSTGTMSVHSTASTQSHTQSYQYHNYTTSKAAIASATLPLTHCTSWPQFEPNLYSLLDNH